MIGAGMRDWHLFDLGILYCYVINNDNMGWLVQERPNSSSSAVELRLPCTNPPICTTYKVKPINEVMQISMVSCQKGPTRHAYAWQIGPF